MPTLNAGGERRVRPAFENALWYNIYIIRCDDSVESFGGCNDDGVVAHGIIPHLGTGTALVHLL